MNAMLLLIFACVGFGLLTARFGNRALLGVPLAAAWLTLLYLVFPRYMN